MSTTQEVSFTILRGASRTCSACRAAVSAGVMVQAARSTASVHFLFCRICARRIGVVEGVIGGKKSKRSSQTKTAGG